MAAGMKGFKVKTVVDGSETHVTRRELRPRLHAKQPLLGGGTNNSMFPEIRSKLKLAVEELPRFFCECVGTRSDDVAPQSREQSDL